MAIYGEFRGIARRWPPSCLVDGQSTKWPSTANSRRFRRRWSGFRRLAFICINSPPLPVQPAAVRMRFRLCGVGAPDFPFPCATNRRLNFRRDARPGNGPNFKKRAAVQDLESNYKIWKGVYTIRRQKSPVFTTVGDPFPSVQFVPLIARQSEVHVGSRRHCNIPVRNLPVCFAPVPVSVILGVLGVLCVDCF